MAAPDPRLPSRGRELSGLLERALADQRSSFAGMVDDDVLQYACAGQQDLLEIQQAHPSEALAAAIVNVSEAIDALRRLVAREVTVDERLLAEAETAISWAFLSQPGGVVDRSNEEPDVTAADLSELAEALGLPVSSTLAEQIAQLEAHEQDGRAGA